MLITTFAETVEEPFKAIKFIFKSPKLTGQKLLFYRVRFGKPEIEIKHF